MAIRKVGLNVYGFSIQDRENQRRELHNINGRTLIEHINDYADNNVGQYVDDAREESVFCFDSKNEETVYNDDNQEIYKIFYGRIKTGEYGIESELVDKQTGNISYNRTSNDADVMPFGFAVLLPAGQVNSGIIILQSIGNYAMKSILHKKLRECIRNIDEDLKFEMGVIVPRVVLDRFFEHGVLQKIRLIRYGIPNDLSERYGLNLGVEEIVEERVIRKPQGFLQNKRREINEWRAGARAYNTVIQLDDFEYDDLKMEFRFGRTSKTISLRSIDNLQMTEDITENVNLQGGHPEFTSLCVQMKETGEFYLRARGLILE